MGIFSRYTKPRKDREGTHPHNVLHKTIVAHANEVIEIRVGSTGSASYGTKGYSSNMHEQRQNIMAQKEKQIEYYEHRRNEAAQRANQAGSGIKGTIYRKAVEANERKIAMLEKQEHTGYRQPMHSSSRQHIAGELRRRANTKPPTLSEYIGNG